MKVEVRKKMYFVDYTDKFKAAERFYKALCRERELEPRDILLKDLFKFTKLGGCIFHCRAPKKILFTLRDTTDPKKKFAQWNCDYYHNAKSNPEYHPAGDEEKICRGYRSKQTVYEKVATIKSLIEILSELSVLGENRTALNRLEECIDKLYDGDTIYDLSNAIIIPAEEEIIVLRVGFTEFVEQSGYGSIHGHKQCYTDTMEEIYQTRYRYEYNKEWQVFQAENQQNAINKFAEILKYKALEDYINMAGIIPVDVETRISAFVQGNVRVLYDEGTPCNVMKPEYTEARALIVFGYSRPEIAIDRKQNDRDMWVSEVRRWADSETDRGHYSPHSVGGTIFANLYPQKRDVNQGLSEEGQVFRNFERLIKKKPDTFFFVRPIYFDHSNRPYLVEYGFLDQNENMRVQSFVNV